MARTNVTKVYDKVMDEIQKFIDTGSCKLTKATFTNRALDSIMIGDRHFEYGGKEYVGVCDGGVAVWFIPKDYWRFDTELLIDQGVFTLFPIDRFTTPDMGDFIPAAYLGIGGAGGTLERLGGYDVDGYMNSYDKENLKKDRNITPAIIREPHGVDFFDRYFNAHIIERFVKIADDFTFCADGGINPIYFKAANTLLGFVLPIRNN